MAKLLNLEVENTQSVVDIIRNDVLEMIYPVGSIYMSMNSISPSQLFGGTWEQIEGRFLFGCGNLTAMENTANSYGELNAIYTETPAGETAGQFVHTLTTNEMPNHNHRYFANIQHEDGTVVSGESLSAGLILGGRRRYTDLTYAAGGGAGHNNMPPYLAVYMWKRTA